MSLYISCVCAKCRNKFQIKTFIGTLDTACVYIYTHTHTHTYIYIYIYIQYSYASACSEYTPRACRYTLSQTRSLAGVKPRVGVYRETTKLLATYAKVRLTPSSFRWICKSRVDTSRRCSNARHRFKRREIRFDDASLILAREIDVPGLLWIESLVRSMIHGGIQTIPR